MDEEEQLPAWRSSPPRVVAVLVSRRGERWLPQTLASLAQLEHLPAEWVAVDVAPKEDASGTLLREALGDAHVVEAPAGTGFGDAVRLGLDHASGPAEWVWLLHDDAIVDPGALTALLDEATSAEDIAVVGPKIREWPSLQRLLEVGRTVTGTGRLETGLEPGEPDAGQHDWPRDVLAVNTAGMLVRNDAWERLGGLDPALPLFFDDVDFGWRVARAGLRTRTAPPAVIFHAEASARRTRRRRVVAGEQRRAAVYTVLANETGFRFWWQSVRFVLGSLLRMIADLVFKDTRGARGEAAALRSVFAAPRRMRGARRDRAATATVARREIRHLFPSAWLPYQHGWDVMVESVQAMVRPEAVQTLGRRASSLDVLDEEIVVEDADRWYRRYPWATTLLVLVLLALIAARGFWTGSVASPVLPASPDSVADWWRDLMARTVDGAGLPASSWPAPYLPVIALVGLPFAFAPGLLPWTILVLAVPLAAMTAHRFGRLITDHRVARMIWAVSYGVLVAGTGAVAQGRLGTVVALVLAPLLANVVTHTLVTPSWTRAAQVGLWLAVVSVFAPAGFLIAIVAIAGLLIVARLRPPRELLAGVVAAALVAGPSWWARFLHPSLWWWEAGVPRGVDTTALDILGGLGGGPGATLPWLSFGVLVLGVLALVPRATRYEVSVSWVVALSGLVIAAIGMLVPAVAGPPGSSAWSGLGSAIWIAGLGTAALLAAGEIARAGRRVALGLTVLALVFPLGAGAWWVARGIEGPLASTAEPTVPAYLADQDITTLMVSGDIEDGVTIDVVHGRGPHLGQETARPAPERRDDFAAVVARLVAEPSSASVQDLADAGVQAIYLPDASTDAAARISAAPGLAPAGSDRPGSRVWTVEVEPSDDIDTPEASAARPVLVGVWLLGWGALAIGAIPGRGRAEQEEEL